MHNVQATSGDGGAAGKRRFRAVVDWIKIEIRTERPTNFTAVQRVAKAALKLPGSKKPHVKPYQYGPGGAATAFVVTVQDPERASRIDDLLRAVRVRFGDASTASVRAVEIALDAYNSEPAFVAHFFKFATHLVSDNQRLYREGKGSGYAMPDNVESLTRYLTRGYQIGIGDANADRYQHLYYKTTDSGSVPLPADEHRARFEIRLSNDGLPRRAWQDWRGFRFEALAEYFRFRKLKEDADAMGVREGRAHNLGSRRVRNRKEGGTRLYSKATVADTELNAHARNALRKLSGRWRATGKRGRPPVTAKRPLAEIRSGFPVEAPTATHSEG